MSLCKIFHMEIYFALSPRLTIRYQRLNAQKNQAAGILDLIHSRTRTWKIDPSSCSLIINRKYRYLFI